MTINYRLLTRFGPIPLLTLFMAGCGGVSGDTEATGESLAQAEVFHSTTQALSSYNGLTYWSSPSTIKICFMKASGHPWNSSSADTSDATRSQQVLDALNGSWGAVTGLQFVRKTTGVCSSPAQDDLPILLREQVANGGDCLAGKGARQGPGSTNDWTQDVQCELQSGPQTLEGFLGVAIHEVGHAIGMSHEHQRGVMSGGNVVHEVPLCPGAAATYASDPTNGNLAPFIVPELTPYDRCSIMNYCAAEWGCSTVLYRSATDPMSFISAMDALGAEMLYPKEERLRLGCDKGCFQTADGAVTRLNGSITDEWSSRGAYNWWDTEGLGWYGPRGALGHGATFSAGNTASVYDITFAAGAELTGDVVHGDGLLINDDAQWTALAMSVL